MDAEINIVCPFGNCIIYTGAAKGILSEIVISETGFRVSRHL